MPVRRSTPASVTDGARLARGAAARGLLALAAVAIAACAVATGLFADPGMRAATAGAGPSAGAGGSAPVTEVAAGHSIYLQTCASCHGAQGEGGPNAPPVAGAGEALTDFVLRTGRMPLADPRQPSRRGEPVLDDASIRAVVAYVASLGGGPTIPNVTVDGADLAAGQRLYTANCAACHGATGAGGAVGGNFIAPPLYQSDPRTVGEAVVTGPGPMPAFAFGPAELNDLVAYVESLKNPPHPGGLAVAEVGPVAEGFLALFVGLLTLLVLARWIARGPEE